MSTTRRAGVIGLMVNLLVSGGPPRNSPITQSRSARSTTRQPALAGCSLTALHHIRTSTRQRSSNVFGQGELNDETWAIAQSDLMMQDTAPERMRNSNNLTSDAFPTEKFDYILANPPSPDSWRVAR